MTSNTSETTPPDSEPEAKKEHPILWLLGERAKEKSGENNVLCGGPPAGRPGNSDT